MALEKIAKVPALLRKARGVADTRPFYSPIDQAIAEITQTKATGDQMLAALLKTKGAAKELKDRPAIKKALEQPKVTKQELERVAAEHPAPQVEEKVLSGQSFDERHPKLPTDGTLELVENPETFGFEKYPYGVVDKQTGDIIAYGNDKEDAILDAYSGYPKYWGGGTRYAQYTIPHGENYREVLLKIPSRRPSIKNMSRDEYNAAVAKADQEGIQDFQTQHFEGEPNILAHARVSDRVGPNGEKILHVEEIQSDLHQEGRKKGYRSEDSEKAYSDYLEDLKARVKEDIKKTMMQEGVAEEKALLLAERMAERISQDPRKLANYFDEGDRQMALHQQRIKDRSAVPDAPFKQNWHELVMKRLLDDAARNGYDKVVITPGKTQIDRYTDELRANLDSIEYEPYLENGKQMFELAGYKNGAQIFNEEAVTPERLRKLLGKSMHEKIMQGHGESLAEQRPLRPEWKRITGDDISVGGEGMKGFYDQTLPSFLNDYGKPYGAKVGTYQMPDFETPLHSFDITPQMREDIIGKGLPLYQVAPVGIGAGAAMQEQPEGYGAGGVIKKTGQIIGKAAQSSGMARPVTATKNLLTPQDFYISLGDRIGQGVAEKQNLIESMPFKYDKGQRVFTEDSARKNRLPYEILNRTLYGDQPMRADHPVLGPGMGAVIKDPDTGKAMRTPFEAGYRVRSESPEGWQEFVLPETAIKGDVEMAGGGAVKKAAKAISALKGQQAVLPAAESASNLEKFLANSAVKGRVYHGTMSPDINQFRTPAYFSSKDVANEFADPNYLYGTSKLEEGEHPNVLPVYLNIKKPKVYTTEEEYEKHVMGLTGSPKDLVKQGYDGIIYAPGGKLDDPDAYFVPFEPTQIKSAIGNRGTYDIKEADMNKAKGGSVSNDAMFVAVMNKKLKGKKNA